MQPWPRGYPGDFQTIDYSCDAHNLAQRHTVAVAYYCEQSAHLGAAISVDAGGAREEADVFVARPGIHLG
jgi:hypothetical protein